MQDNLDELIIATNEQLGIGKSFIEKDYHVTRIIHALADTESEYFKLIFQGGTCLSKAHLITERMSEDCDFRMQPKTSTQALSKAKLRNELKKFRNSLVNSLSDNGFYVEKEPEVRNEGNFMRFWVRYDSLYVSLQFPILFTPNILLEFIQVETKTPTVNLPVTSLIRQTLGKVVDHKEKNIDCVSIIETAAEKWVALTRRIVRTEAKLNTNDIKLIRHLYDLHAIAETVGIGAGFDGLVSLVMSEDREREKNTDYYLDPIAESKKALKILTSNPIWRDYWEKFIATMVFQREKPSFDVVMASLLKLSEQVFKS
ncbi:MAG: nucleotidyl transferase AbiEii/AbiGii toxin family protein [Gammaproteobacteria bacterium]